MRSTVIKAFTKLPKPSQARVMEEATATSQVLLTDAELCNILRISPVTLKRHIKNGPPRSRRRDPGDLRMIRNFMVGGKRRWARASVNEFINGEQ